MKRKNYFNRIVKAEDKIFRIADDEIMTAPLLAEYIRQHELLVQSHYKYLDDAYQTDYSIFHQAKKKAYKPDNRLATNFAKYIVDTMNGFFCGIPIKVTSNDERINKLIQRYDRYNSMDDQNAEIAKTCDIFGSAYEMYYVDEMGEVASTVLSPMNAFIVYNESIIPQPRYFVRLYVDNHNIKRGSISDEETVRYFKQDGGVKFDEYEKMHGFDGVPATEFLENAERTGLFEPVLSLINAYNKALSEKANDVDYFADAYLKILGAKLKDEDLKTIRDDRIINFDGIEDGKLIVEFMDKPNGDTTQENLIDRLRTDIFQIAMVANISDENFGASSGIALKYKLLAMSNLAKMKQNKFIGAMNRRYRLICSNPVTSAKADDWLFIDYQFTQNIPANQLEEAQIAAQLSGVTSKETQLKALSIVDDVKDEIKKIDAESDKTSYSTDYPTERTGGGMNE
jgi:SPP1 family phage portal protein|nr:MAG TPA: PORTAL PROTEIN [Caudoviricetes sp.]